MAGPEGFDFNKLAQQMNLGGPKPGDDNAKPEDLSDFLNKLFEKVGDWVTKATGVNVRSFFNTGLTANVDFQKGAIQVNNEINRSNLVKGAQGGALAGIVFGEVFKASNAPRADAPSGGDAGGWGGGSGGDYASSGGGGGFADYSAIASPSHSFDWSPVPMAMLGELTPPPINIRAPSVGMDVGLA